MTASDTLRIRRMDAFHVPVGLRRPVRHASFTRTHNETLVVRCELSDGSVGWGEGLPRTYVTGESIGSVWRHLHATDFSAFQSARFSDPMDVVALCDSYRLAGVPPDSGVEARECFGNSVRCAIEVSMLDAVCRGQECSLAEFIAKLPEARKLSQTQAAVRYSGVATASEGMRQWRTAFRMKIFGFRQVKIKVGAAGVNDVQFVSRIRRMLGSRVDLRIDANEAWSATEVVDRLGMLTPFGISSVEQPVPHAEVAELAEIRKHVDVPVMLDESLCCREDAERAIEAASCDLFNLRLSKCGGIVACVRLAALAVQNGLGYQLGCQVGETGILSAAGRQFACQVKGIRYLEGSYDGFLVRDRLTRENLTFGFGGRASRLSGNGLGVTIDDRQVEALSVRSLRLL